MIRPDFQRATIISCVAHLLLFIMALIVIGFRSPHKSRVYTISLVSPAGTSAPAHKKPARRTPPPKSPVKERPEIPRKQMPPEKKTAPEEEKAEPVEKKEDPEPAEKRAQEAIQKLKQQQDASENEEQEKKRLTEQKDRQRLEDLRNRLAAEGASESDSRIPQGERNDILDAYKRSIVPLIKENWIFPDVSMGTRTEVSITVFVDGTIRINSITTPSGNRAFDQSVLKAIIRTGRVEPPPFGRNEDVTLNFIPVRK